MACKTDTKEIGEHTYSVTQWPATKAILIKLKLIKTFGATLARISGSALETSDKKKKDNSENDAKAISEGLSLMFQDNSPEEILVLMKECVLGTGCDGAKITATSFEELFSGDNLLEVYKVFLFVLRVNYSDLMKGQLADRLLAKVQESL